METPRIDELARKLLESVPAGLRSLQTDLESNFRSVLRSNLSKLDLLTREEFDTQAKVLERTRSRLEALEARVAQMEAAEPGDLAGAPQTRDSRESRGASPDMPSD